ncbi:hypothetical protein F383_22707 [Gossypium arboreum]|uniref:Uncharacterized protein n=1 Tax=Gossypium arboreum TaxID=29729 RepID=A0A0B0P3B3_GOSAR|nr:hypothetical protein F383_22707 [Gossypium arboreum]
MPMILFTLITMIENHGFASDKNFVTVDLTMKGILYRLGNGKCILGWVNHKHMSFEYLRLTIWCNEQ